MSLTTTLPTKELKTLIKLKTLLVNRIICKYEFKQKKYLNELLFQKSLNDSIKSENLDLKNKIIDQHKYYDQVCKDKVIINAYVLAIIIKCKNIKEYYLYFPESLHSLINEFEKEYNLNHDSLNPSANIPYVLNEQEQKSFNLVKKYIALQALLE